MDNWLTSVFLLCCVAMVMGRHTPLQTDEFHKYSMCLTDEECGSSDPISVVFDNNTYCCKEGHKLAFELFNFGIPLTSVLPSLGDVMGTIFKQDNTHKPVTTSNEADNDQTVPDSKDTSSDDETGLLDNILNDISSEISNSKEGNNNFFDEGLLKHINNLQESMRKHLSGLEESMLQQKSVLEEPRSGSDNKYATPADTDDDGNSQGHFTALIKTNKNKLSNMTLIRKNETHSVPQNRENRTTMLSSINNQPGPKLESLIKDIHDIAIDASANSIKVAQDSWRDAVYRLLKWRARRHTAESAAQKILRLPLPNDAANTETDNVSEIQRDVTPDSLTLATHQSGYAPTRLEDTLKQKITHKCKKHKSAFGSPNSLDMANDELLDQKEKVILAEDSKKNDQNIAKLVDQNAQRNKVKDKGIDSDKHTPLKMLETKEMSKLPSAKVDDNLLSKKYYNKKSYIPCRCVPDLPFVSGRSSFFDLLGFLDTMLKEMVHAWYNSVIIE